MSQDQVSLFPIDPDIVLRLLDQQFLRPLDEKFRAVLHPGVIQRHVVGDKIEHQLQTAFRQALAQASQCSFASELSRDGIGGDRKPGPGDVLFPQVRQGLLKLLAPPVVEARNSLPCQTGLPNTQEPYPVKTQVCQPVQFRVRDVVQLC